MKTQSILHTYVDKLYYDAQKRHSTQVAAVLRSDIASCDMDTTFVILLDNSLAKNKLHAVKSNISYILNNCAPACSHIIHGIDIYYGTRMDEIFSQIERAQYQPEVSAMDMLLKYVRKMNQNINLQAILFCENSDIKSVNDTLDHIQFPIHVIIVVSHNFDLFKLSRLSAGGNYYIIDAGDMTSARVYVEYLKKCTYSGCKIEYEAFAGVRIIKLNSKNYPTCERNKYKKITQYIGNLSSLDEVFLIKLSLRALSTGEFATLGISQPMMRISLYCKNQLLNVSTININRLNMLTPP